MVKLSGIIANAIIDEYGADELVKRLADPYWLQALSNTLGYDWHSSGATTVTMGALKSALNCNSDIYIAGGKGKEGTRTPEQIIAGVDYLSIGGKAEEFVRYSRLIAKIDSALVYDDISIYHHTFVMSKNGEWAIVQQAMQDSTSMAVRFQVLGSRVDEKDAANETNSGVNGVKELTMDLTYSRNSDIRASSVTALREDIQEVLRVFEKLYVLPARHKILPADLSSRAKRALEYANEMQPESYEQLLGVKGVGRRTLRSLAIISSLIYDKDIYKRDPTMYAYNLGGKDRIPYEINLRVYDDVVRSLGSIVEGTKINPLEKEKALRRLHQGFSRSYSDG
ncbi:protein containing DUF763 [mine drainage metagenome]|uniref:Protein containing DUF763 n=2 Tax=mine drainage metagenome TaxID=410659 RepID=T0YYX5_9ZZZZ